MFRNTILILVLVASMTAILYLTDGTNTVDLLESDGYVLSAWRPQVADYKDGGVWQSSTITRGRRLTQKHFDNVVETIELKLKAVSQNAAARFTQDLKRMLEAASDYWVNRWNSTPVYLVYKPSKVDNTQYALVYRGRIPEEENPFAQPFLQPNCAASMDNLTLLVERDHWTENAPGTGTCVETSAERDYLVTTVSTGPFSPAAQNDDSEYYADYWHNFACRPATTDLTMGNDALAANGASITNGIRFTNVTVPAGATILKAYITFQASSNNALTPVFLRFYGEDADDASDFATCSDFVDRTKQSRTDAYVDWGFGNLPVPAWTTGNDYNTPDLSTIIQEIVDRGGWASGQDMAIFVFDNGSGVQKDRLAYSFDDPAGDPPELYITYTSDDLVPYGREETCEKEVYVANKDNEANISDVWTYDASDPLYTSEYGNIPYYLLGDHLTGAIANGDIAYFGCNTSLNDSGPFASLVLDLDTSLVIAGGAKIIWEYWDGAAWEDLPIMDNTDAGTGAFTTNGVNSVHWIHPSDWATNDPGMGVTGYWVRARVDLTSGTITGTVQQQNREVYSITWSHIQIDEAQVPGDVSALCRIKLYNESSGPGYATNPILFANRVIIGSRSDSRGTNFRAYLNFADEQNPNGIVINIDPLYSTFQADVTAPAGRSVFYEPDNTGEVGMETRAIVEFQGRDIIQEYVGRYHVWVRCKLIETIASGTSMTIRLAKSMPGSEPVVVSEEVVLDQYSTQRALDMGEITLPISGLPISILADSSFGDRLYVQAQASGVVGDWDAGDGLVLYDLILIPIDEWVGEFLDPSDFVDFESTLGQSEWGNQRYLDANSISSPKDYITGTIHQRPAIVGLGEGSDPGVTRWIERTNGELVLKANVDQRLFLFAEQFPVYNTTSYFYNKPYQGYSVQVFRNARYLGMRGDR